MQLKNACHLLGFDSDPKDRIALNIIKQEKVVARAEGFEDKFTFPLLIEALTHFIDSDPKVHKDFQEIKEAFEVSHKAYLNNQNIDTNQLFERYKNNKMVIIPSGWSGHSITLALYQNKLIISNRGELKHSDGGVTVFQLKDELIAQFKQNDPEHNKAQFSLWIKSIETLYSRILSDELAKQIISMEPSITIPTLDLTVEEPNLKLEKDFFTEAGIPKRHPILVQEWMAYELGVGDTLPDKYDRTKNSCFLASDALYQIDDQWEAKKIPIKDFKKFTIDLIAIF